MSGQCAQEHDRPIICVDPPDSWHASKPGRVEIPETVNVGEILAGDAADFVVARPLVRDPSLTATMVATIDQFVAPGMGHPTSGPNPFRILQPARPLFMSMKDSEPLMIRFSPAHYQLGLSHGFIAIRIFWSNGAMETRTLRVVAASRSVVNVPSDSQNVSPRESATSDVLQAPDKAPPKLEHGEQYVTRSEEAIGNVGSALSASLVALLGNQKDGVKYAMAEAAAFRRAPPPPSLMMALIETALNIASAGIASAITRHVAKDVQVAFHLADHSPTLDLVADSLKDLTKDAAKAVVGMSLGQPYSDGGEVESSALEVSADPLIQFFATQETMCDRAAMQTQTFVRDSLTPAMRGMGEGGLAVMRSIDRVVADQVGSSNPKTVQAQASAMQWMKLVALSSHEIEEARTVDGRSAGMVSKLRDTAFDGENRDGVVTLFSEIYDKDLSTLRITDASITGISSSMAFRLKAQSLGKLGLPIIIKLRVSNGGPYLSAITIDEAGRIRFVGQMPLLSYFDGRTVLEEHEGLKDAEKIVRVLRPQSLATLGVVLRTNDLGR